MREQKNQLAYITRTIHGVYGRIRGMCCRCGKGCFGTSSNFNINFGRLLKTILSGNGRRTSILTRVILPVNLTGHEQVLQIVFCLGLVKPALVGAELRNRDGRQNTDNSDNNQ